MFIKSVGRGPTVVFIPGLGCDHTMYAPQVEALRDRFRCVSLDVPGTGRSPSLPDLRVDDVLTHQADAIAGALRGLGVERAHLVGISYGGVLVQTLMLRHGALAASAIICDSLCDTRARTVPEWFRLAPARLQPLALRLAPARTLAAGIRAAYGKWPRAGEAMARALLAARPRDLILQRRAVNAVHYERLLRSCRTPALCLVGDHSALAVEMMRRTHEALANSEFDVIADSFDPSSLCRPEEFTRRVGQWVEARCRRTGDADGVEPGRGAAGGS